MTAKFLLSALAGIGVAVPALAADAVMAPEPEPVEYVRICDAYGAGFFYIPGTDTCLQVSGYVWYQIGVEGWSAFPDTPPYIGTAVAGVGWPLDGWNKSVRARVNFDARSETEWGTLRAYVRFEADWNGVGDGPVAADQAFIELGGLKMGYSESFWVDSGNGGPSNYGSHSWGGMYYGYQQRALIGYRFEANGFFGAISLEDDAFGVDAALFGPPVNDGYLPDVVAKIGYAAGWGAIWAKVAYDEDRTNLFTWAIDPTQAGDDGFSAQLGIDLNVPNMPGSSLRLIAFYSDSDNAFSTGTSHGTLFNVVNPGLVTAGGSEWSFLASYNHQFSPTLGASVAAQYFKRLYLPGTDIGDSGWDAWAGELSIVWVPLSDFEVRTELHYDKIDTFDGTYSGYLRFTRYF